MKKLHITLLFSLLLSMRAAFGQDNPTGEKNKVGTALPITLLEKAGTRPVVAYTINSKKALSVIHSNASAYISVTFRNATYFGMDNLTKRGKYGIVSPGKVGDSYTGYIKEMKFGPVTINKVYTYIYEMYPTYEEGLCMLGLPWITQNRIILNYKDEQVFVLPNKVQQDSLASRLKQEKYVAMPIKRDTTDGRYYVPVTVNGIETRFVVNTVANSITIDSTFAKSASIKQDKVTGHYGGPSGAVGNNYSAKDSVSLAIGSYHLKIKDVLLENMYAYINAKRPTDPKDVVGGQFGGAFMKKRKAVIDFGNLLIYLKPE